MNDCRVMRLSILGTVGLFGSACALELLELLLLLFKPRFRP